LKAVKDFVEGSIVWTEAQRAPREVRASTSATGLVDGLSLFLGEAEALSPDLEAHLSDDDNAIGCVP